MDEKGQHVEAKVFYLAALEGRRRVHVGGHKETLDLLAAMRCLLYHTKDYEGALDYYQ